MAKTSGTERIDFWKKDSQRKPYWRYEVVQRYLGRRGGRIPSFLQEDSWISRLWTFCRSFRRLLNRFTCHRPSAPRALSVQVVVSMPSTAASVALQDDLFRYECWKCDPHLTEAYQMFLKTESDSQRSELEARILARQSLPEIAHAMSLEDQSVACYVACFYDVMDRLDNTSYVLHHAIGLGSSASSAGAPLHQLMRAIGYFSGAEELERLLSGGLKGVDSEAGIAEAYEWQIRFAGWYAALAMPNLMNRFNVVEIARLSETALARRQAVKVEEQGVTRWDKALLSVMESLPWSVGAPQESHLKQLGYPELNKVGQEPRAQELIAGVQDWEKRRNELDRRLRPPKHYENKEDDIR